MTKAEEMELSRMNREITTLKQMIADMLIESGQLQQGPDTSKNMRVI